MKTFTGAEYLMIDLANAYGLDGEIFEERIQWVRDNVIPNLNDTSKLDEYANQADEPILFIKGWKTIIKAIKGEPTGHLVEFDATTSGPQIMSALTCDIKGGKITNLIDPTTRYDCYMSVYQEMVKRLGNMGTILRKEIKLAVNFQSGTEE